MPLTNSEFLKLDLIIERNPDADYMARLRLNDTFARAEIFKLSQKLVIEMTGQVESYNAIIAAINKKIAVLSS